MNKCVNCGNDLIPGDKFCRRCGTPINNQNNMNGGMPNQMSNSNVHFTNNMNTQNNNTGFNNQYNNNYNNNFNNNLNSNVNYNMNNNSNTKPPRKDNLSTLIIIIVALVIGVLFILFMPTIKKTTENDTIIIKDNPTDSKKDDNNNNSSINTGKNNNTSNNGNNSSNNSGNNNSGNNSGQKSTITFYETTLNKRSDYSYKFTTSGTANYLLIQNKNGDDEVIVQGIYKASISDINSKSSVVKGKYSQAGYQTGAVKYTTYKGKKLYTLEISRKINSNGNVVTYKMLVGFYEIESGIVASIQIGNIGYTKYNYAGYEFLANIFDGAKVSSTIKNGASYEIKADLSEILNKLLTKE